MDLCHPTSIVHTTQLFMAPTVGPPSRLRPFPLSVLLPPQGSPLAPATDVVCEGWAAQAGSHAHACRQAESCRPAAPSWALRVRVRASARSRGRFNSSGRVGGSSSSRHGESVCESDLWLQWKQPLSAAAGGANAGERPQAAEWPSTEAIGRSFADNCTQT